MPNRKIMIDATMECTFDPHRLEGNSISFMATPVGIVTDGERKVAEIHSCINGAIEITDALTGQVWHLDLKLFVENFLGYLRAHDGATRPLSEPPASEPQTSDEQAES